MKLEQLRNFIDSKPGPTGPEIDAQARAWLAAHEYEVEHTEGDGSPIVLIVFGVDENPDPSVFALPGSMLDEQAHRDLAAVHGAYFEWFFSADLRPEQYAGAFRFCGGASEEPDVFEDQITEIRPDAEDAGVEIDFDGIQASVGSWNAHRVERGGALPGPISHVYVANLCM